MGACPGRTGAVHPSAGWVGPELPGLVAGDGPALAFYGVSLAMAWTGTDGHLNEEIATGFDAHGLLAFGSTVTYQAYQECSQYRPSLATFNGDLSIAWTQTNHLVDILDLARNGNNAPVITVPNAYSTSRPTRLRRLA